MNKLLPIYQAASLAMCAFADAKGEPGGYADRALAIIANNLEVMESHPISPSMFSVLEEQEERAMNNLILSGYVRS